jgi:hypothetical protein
MPSKAYSEAVAQMRKFHLTRKVFSGNGVLKHRESLVQFSDRIGAASGIDYGCGKGYQYDLDKTGGYSLEAALGYAPYRYDPGVSTYEIPPDVEADLVWCVDVLECVPEEDMGEIIADLARMAVKGLFVTVASYPSKKQLPDGRNAHLTIKNEDWWREQFAPLAVERPDLKLVLLVA